MDTIKSILDHQGLGWTDVVKVTKYLTDMRDMDSMVAVMAEYFGAWSPASTTVCVNQLSTPGARVEPTWWRCIQVGGEPDPDPAGPSDYFPPSCHARSAQLLCLFAWY